jgi:hypothetical protein
MPTYWVFADADSVFKNDAQAREIAHEWINRKVNKPLGLYYTGKNNAKTQEFEVTKKIDYSAPSQLPSSHMVKPSKTTYNKA